MEPKKFLEDGDILSKKGDTSPKDPKEVSRASKEEGDMAPMVTR